MPVVVVDGIGRRAATINLLPLAHPAYPGKRATFMRCDGDLFEIQEMRQGKASWFIGSNVISDGALCVATRVDPLLLVLPLLESKATGCFCPLDQFDDDDGLIRSLVELAHCDLQRICDSRALDDGVDVYRLNDTKVVGWLEAKVRRVQAALMKDVVESEAALSVSYLVEAVGIICEYVAPRWIPLLLNQVGLAPDVLDPPKPKPVPVAEPTKKAQQRPATTSRKAKRVKADTSSMRSLRSYFAPKSS